MQGYMGRGPANDFYLQSADDEKSLFKHPGRELSTNFTL